MPFDPLFRETPMSVALRAELGIPEGAELWYLRFIGEVVRFPTVDVGPDGTPEPPRRRPRKAHLRAGYEVVYVYSLDAGTGTAPMWWGPGQLWLTRLRFGEDPVYGERRPPRPDNPHGEPRYSVTEEGNMAKASLQAVERARRGIVFLYGEIAGDGRQPEALRPTEQRAETEEHIIQGIERLLRVNRVPYEEIAQEDVAGACGWSRSTYQRRLSRYRLDEEALRAQALRRYRASHPLSPASNL